MAERVIKTRFYEFRQNNSGGSFATYPDKGIGIWVFIEAQTADEANQRAEDIGLYFNGVEDDRDCDCCGDRWYPAEEHNKNTIEDHTFDWACKDAKSWKSGAYVHFYDKSFMTLKQGREKGLV